MDQMEHLRTYQQLLKLPTFRERYEYLRCHQQVGLETFGYQRYLNQQFYRSKEWRQIRNQVIARDNGCDLGIKDRPITGSIYIHHMNPISVEDVIRHSEDVFDMDQLICCSYSTHNAIHYGDDSLLVKDVKVRAPNDTTPWK